MSRRTSIWSVAILMAFPLCVLAQNQPVGGAGGGGGNLGGAGNGLSGGGQGGMGTFGRPNTTLLGSQIDLNFNSVFGNNPTIANTNADPFSAYRLSGTGTSSSMGTGGGRTNSSGFGGTTTSLTQGPGGMSRTTQFGGTGLTGGQVGGGFLTGGMNTGLNLGQNRAGGLGGNLGGLNLGGGFNRTNTFGGMNAMGGMNMGRNMGMMGGGSSFLGGFGNNPLTQQQQQTPGYLLVPNIPPASPSATPVSPSAVTNEIQQRLLAAPALAGAQNLQVAFQGDTVVLKGKVATENAKQMAAAMLRLEPGVYQVENQLEVVAVAPPPPVPPKP